MRNPNGFRTVLLIAPPLLLLLPLSILVFALERISTALFSAHTTRDWRYGTYDVDDDSDLTIRIDSAPDVATILLCLAGYIASVLGACGVWEVRRVEGSARRERAWFWVIIMTGLVMASASLGVLGWASGLEGGGWKTKSDVGNGARYTRETWLCNNIPRFYPEEDWAGAACGVTKATRFMMIPVAISSALMVLSAWVLIGDRGGVKWWFGGRGRYGGFDSVYEMQPRQQEAIKAQNDRMAFR